ncbi:hypothetical protein DM860_012310 [Cuscuta australis]|uniref:Uncharacterized protein n=1 Tax=Cuscuta australis TaxID=267555 RepID=A0A328DPU4_9ASTE|nr:hypothetical protein DM860_012310 [Cuscuta australis]
MFGFRLHPEDEMRAARCINQIRTKGAINGRSFTVIFDTLLSNELGRCSGVHKFLLVWLKCKIMFQTLCCSKLSLASEYGFIIIGTDVSHDSALGLIFLSESDCVLYPKGAINMSVAHLLTPPLVWTKDNALSFCK